LKSTTLRVFHSLGLTAVAFSPLAFAQVNVGDQLSAQIGFASPAIIAHRGDSYNAPESTLPAYQLACEVGSDYLEVDLQRSKDGKLIAVHDNNLRRKTNIDEIFPERADEPVSSFTWKELQQLDAGSWFNAAYPERARSSFEGLQLVSLDQVSEIARNCEHQPGLYIETKIPNLFPGIEKDLKENLVKNGWIEDGQADRIILQTFEKSSLIALQEAMPEVPKVLLLWVGDGYMEAKPTEPKAEGESFANFYARQQIASKAEFEKWLDFAKETGAIGIGPSTRLSNYDDPWSSQFSYMDLAKPWMVEMSHNKGLVMHAYTLDEPADLLHYRERGLSGFFTNRPDVARAALLDKETADIEAILQDLSY